MFLSGFPHNYLPITNQVSESWKCPNGRSLQFQVHNRAPVTGPTGWPRNLERYLPDMDRRLRQLIIHRV